MAFRYISGGEHPDHDTIANFRKRFLDELEGLFKQILVLAQALGVLRMGRVSLDGTKMHGNASKRKAMSWGMQRSWSSSWRERCRRCWSWRSERIRRESRGQQELDIPEELERREKRLAAIREAKEKIEERAQERHEVERAEYEEKLRRRQEREEATGKKVGGRPPKEPEAGPREKDQVNFTDEESRIIPGANGEFIQGYNAQAVVEQESHLVVGKHVSQAANDKQEVEPELNELDKVAEELGKPEALVADAGYHSKENVEAVRGAGYRAVYRGEPRTPQSGTGRAYESGPRVPCGGGCGDGDEASLADD